MHNQERDLRSRSRRCGVSSPGNQLLYAVLWALFNKPFGLRCENCVGHSPIYELPVRNIWKRLDSEKPRVTASGGAQRILDVGELD